MYWECRVPEMLRSADLHLTISFLGRRKCNSSCCAAIFWGSVGSMWYSYHLHGISMQNRSNTAPLPSSCTGMSPVCLRHVFLWEEDTADIASKEPRAEPRSVLYQVDSQCPTTWNKHLKSLVYSNSSSESWFQLGLNTS